MIRSEEHILGLPNVDSRIREQLDMGTKLMQVTAKLCRYASQNNVPWVIENPQTSLIWSTPEFQGLLAGLDVTKIVTHMCGFGARWKNQRPCGALDWKVSTR